MPMEFKKSRLTRGRACDDVRSSSLDVIGSLEGNVSIDEVALRNELRKNLTTFSAKGLPATWKQQYHFFDPQQECLSMQFIFVLNTLNFCLWPLPGYEYKHLSDALSRELRLHPSTFSSHRLATIDSDYLQTVLLRYFDHSDLCVGVAGEDFVFPLVEERARLLRELGCLLRDHFDGQAFNLVAEAQHRADNLVDLLTQLLPGFRDQAIYKGQQVFLYGRAQALVGDIWGAFGGVGIGRFDDAASIVVFADHRLPQLLRQLGILKYSNALSSLVDSEMEIAAGSEYEIEIRCATVQVGELSRRILNALLAQQGRPALLPVQIDWMLWEQGEKRKRELQPHHRVYTMFY